MELKIKIASFLFFFFGAVGFIGMIFVGVLSFINRLPDMVATFYGLLCAATMGLGIGIEYLFRERLQLILDEKERKEKEEEKKQRQEREKLKQERHEKQVKEHGPYYWREVFPIHGDPQFTQTVERILQELKDRAPHRYEEAVHFLPKAHWFDPIHFNYSGLYQRNGTVEGYIERPFSGRADGLFAIDGSDYYRFRYVFLHEVGHCVRGRQNDDWSEEAANAYTSMVLRELER